MIDRDEGLATGSVAEHPPPAARRADLVIAASQGAPQSETRQFGGVEGQVVLGRRVGRRRVVGEGGKPDLGAVVVAEETRLVARADADRPALAEGDLEGAFDCPCCVGWF